MKTQYLNAKSREDRKKILEASRQKVYSTLTKEIFPAWYGTPWAYGGATKVPGQGEIARGWFVYRTLQQAGFDTSFKLARQPSEYIIKNLSPPSTIKIFYNAAPMDKVLGWVEENGDGLYIVGLDIHVGYLIHENGKTSFCHSNYLPPEKVMNQPALEESPLTESNYRVVGKILGDKMMDKWLRGETIELKYIYKES